jgi:hypothetical protein
MGELTLATPLPTLPEEPVSDRHLNRVDLPNDH